MSYEENKADLLKRLSGLLNQPIHLPTEIDESVDLLEVKKKKPPKTKVKSLRKRKWERNPRCTYCFEILSWEETTLDHVIPKSAGGMTTEENTVISCGPCNRKKSNQLWVV